jgi:acetylornithine deacetylase/succinyl-diaminopimelate desuccinylase-like protein
MDFQQLERFIQREWQASVLPALSDYIAIPCQSPAFDPDWSRAGHMEQAVALMADWARAYLADVPNVRIDVVHLEARTPLLLVDVPGDGEPVLVYGHLDKQPAMEGWAPGRSAWSPVLEGERLYGRGGADDGYALFSALVALRALREQGKRHPRLLALIEASEESGSPDLPAHIAELLPRLGTPSAIVALDAGCANYSQLWLTTSVRGQVAGRLHVQVLDEAVHSGDASGVLPSSFRIARALLSRIEREHDGRIHESFHVEIPSERRAQAVDAAVAIGSGLHESLPRLPGVQPIHPAPDELILNRAWRPQLTITALDGLPGVAHAAAVMQPSTTLKLSLRLPPTLDAVAAAQCLKTLLERDPPYGAKVTFDVDMLSPGWHAAPMPPWIRDSLERSSRSAFGAPPASIGGGGGIPFLAMLGERFPATGFVVTGVLGPQSNAHGPNEFLHIPTALRITAVLAQLLHDAPKNVEPA